MSNEQTYICPRCTKQDGKKKLYWNSNKNVGYCFRCGMFNVEAFIRYFGISSLTVDYNPESEPVTRDTDIAYISNVAIDSIYKYPEAVKWLTKYRDISQKIMERYTFAHGKKGTYFEDRIVFAVYDDVGEIVGLQGRKYLTTTDGPSYLFTRGMRSHDIIYPINIEPDNNMILVEGIFDAIKTETCCIFGSMISNKQGDVIYKYNPPKVYLCLDGDLWEHELGKRKLQTNLRTLEKTCTSEIVVIKLPPDKDPDNLGGDLLREFIKDQDNFVNKVRVTYDI